MQSTYNKQGLIIAKDLSNDEPKTIITKDLSQSFPVKMEKNIKILNNSKLGNEKAISLIYYIQNI